MKADNKLSKIVKKVTLLPKGCHAPALSLVFGKVIKFAGTSKVRVEKLDFSGSKLSLKNRKRVQNHIGGVHAAAMALLGESATGFLIGMHVPDNRIPLLKNMNIDYVRRAVGDLTAVATLTDEQINHIRNTEKGDISVPVIITDSEGNQPIKAEFIWAWVPKKR
jgi:acyl-coenzyme A thioesterase PaaI-like protein